MSSQWEDRTKLDTEAYERRVQEENAHYDSIAEELEEVAVDFFRTNPDLWYWVDRDELPESYLSPSTRELAWKLIESHRRRGVPIAPVSWECGLVGYRIYRSRTDLELDGSILLGLLGEGKRLWNSLSPFTRWIVLPLIVAVLAWFISGGF